MSFPRILSSLICLSAVLLAAPLAAQEPTWAQILEQGSTEVPLEDPPATEPCTPRVMFPDSVELVARPDSVYGLAVWAPGQLGSDDYGYRDLAWPRKGERLRFSVRRAWCNPSVGGLPADVALERDGSVVFYRATTTAFFWAGKSDQQVLPNLLLRTPQGRWEPGVWEARISTFGTREQVRAARQRLERDSAAVLAQLRAAEEARMRRNRALEAESGPRRIARIREYMAKGYTRAQAREMANGTVKPGWTGNMVRELLGEPSLVEPVDAHTVIWQFGDGACAGACIGTDEVRRIHLAQGVVIHTEWVSLRR